MDLDGSNASGIPFAPVSSAGEYLVQTFALARKSPKRVKNMQKTISVLVYRTIKHEKYGKYIKKSSVIKAHDEKQECKIGDTVTIYETRPLSKTKRWALSSVLKTVKQA